MSTDAPDWQRLIQENRLEEFLVELRKSAARAEEAAAQRPTWEQLASELLTFRAVAREVLLEGEQHSLAPLGLLPPAEGAPLHLEAQELSGFSLNRSHELVLQQVGAYLVALSDHLWGLASTMVADPPVRPAFVLSRVLLDAAAHLEYLIDAEVDAQVRSVRAVNIRLEGLYAELADLAVTPPDADAESARELQSEIDDLYARGEVDGLVRVVSKKGVVQRHFHPALISTQDMTALSLQDFGPTTWRLLSSVVHAQDRSVIEFTSGRGDIAQVVQGRAYGAMYTGGSVIATTEAVQHAAAALGRLDSRLTKQAAVLNDIWTRAAGLPAPS